MKKLTATTAKISEFTDYRHYLQSLVNLWRAQGRRQAELAVR